MKQHHSNLLGIIFHAVAHKGTLQSGVDVFEMKLAAVHIATVANPTVTRETVMLMMVN